MGPIIMRLRAELRAERRSVLALALLIAIAGAAVLAPLAGARRTDSAYDRFLAGANAHDVETNEGVPGLGYNFRLDLEEVAASPEVADYEIIRVFIVGLTVDGKEFQPGSEAVVIRNLASSGGRLNAFRLLEGRFPDPNRADEVAIGYGRSVIDGIGVGDRLSLDLLSPSLITRGFDDVTTAAKTDVEVVGVVLLPGSIPPAVRYGQIFATHAFERRFAETTANARGILLKLNDRATDTFALKNTLERQAGGTVQFLTSNDQDAGVKRSIDVYAVALRAFSGLAASAALLILTQMLSRQLAVGTDDHPALRSLGMTPRQIDLTAVARTAISAVAGIGGAVLISFALSPLFPVGIARVVEPSPGLKFDAVVLGGGGAILLLAMVAFTVPAARVATRRAARTHNAAEPEGQSSPSRVAALASSAGAPVSVIAGVRLALERGRGRSAMPVRSTIVASAAAVASIVTLIAFGTSMAHLVDTPRLYGWNWDELAGNPYAPDLGEHVTPLLEKAEQIAAYSAGATNVRVLASRPGGPPLDVQALALTPRKGDVDVVPPLIEGRWPNDDDEVALGSGTMRKLAVEIGDQVDVAVAGVSIRATVVGRSVFPVVGDQYGGELGQGVGLTLEGARRIVPNALENIFPVRFRPGATIRDLPDDVRSVFFFTEDTVNVIAAKPADLENLSKVEGTPLALVSLVAALGVMTIAHALMTSVRRRRRDLAILKSVGFVNGQIRAAVGVQATVLALVALLFGVPIGLIVGRAAWIAFAERQGVVAEAVTGSWIVLALIPATIVLANLMAALPGRTAANVSPATVLRTE